MICVWVIWICRSSFHAYTAYTGSRAHPIDSGMRRRRHARKHHSPEKTPFTDQDNVLHSVCVFLNRERERIKIENWFGNMYKYVQSVLFLSPFILFYYLFKSYSNLYYIIYIYIIYISYLLIYIYNVYLFLYVFLIAFVVEEFLISLASAKVCICMMLSLFVSSCLRDAKVRRHDVRRDSCWTCWARVQWMRSMRSMRSFKIFSQLLNHNAVSI